MKKHKVDRILMWEDPAFFGIRDGEKGYPTRIPLNRMRIAYQYVADRIFVERVRAATVSTIDIVPMNKAKKIPAGPIVFYDPCDVLMVRKFKGATIEKSPQFILSTQQCVEYAKGRKRLMHHHFLNFVKRNMGFLEGVASTDADNRKPIPKEEADAAPLPYVSVQSNKELWKEAYAFIDQEFPNAPGPRNTMTNDIPLTPSEAMTWLQKFFKERMTKFAKYEDAIAKDRPWLYHSGISIFLNNGLITPQDVRNKLPKNSPSLEAFARQLFGWREYTRMYYVVVSPDTARLNIFNHKPKALSRDWYKVSEDSSFPPIVQDAVNDAWNMGYLHHIRRLMVLSNYMTLHGVHPDEVYKWMFAFALDSWSWVMVFNVYSMGTWSDGGHAMRKPYVSSSSYLRRMAHLPKGKWSDEWDDAYKAFLKKHKKALQHTILARRNG